ncbi:helix-turn-helix domain-containing protein [Nocardia sp. NPDC003963]
MSRRKPLRAFLDKAMGAGRSQAEIARALGVSPSTVHLWATGKRQPPERYRDSLRAMARPGGKVPPAPPQRTTRSGKPVKTTGSVTITKLPSGAEHVHTHSRKALARELERLANQGREPNSITVLLHGFRSDLYRTKHDATGGPRSRRVELRNLTAEEMHGIQTGRKDAWDAVITRNIEAHNYDGGFTFDRMTSISFDSKP